MVRTVAEVDLQKNCLRLAHRWAELQLLAVPFAGNVNRCMPWTHLCAGPQEGHKLSLSGPQESDNCIHDAKPPAAKPQSKHVQILDDADSVCSIRVDVVCH